MAVLSIILHHSAGHRAKGRCAPGREQSVLVCVVLLERAYPLSGILWPLTWFLVMCKSVTRTRSLLLWWHTHFYLELHT